MTLCVFVQKLGPGPIMFYTGEVYGRAVLPAQSTAVIFIRLWLHKHLPPAPYTSEERMQEVFSPSLQDYSAGLSKFEGKGRKGQNDM